MEWTGRVALVTGASSGIGRAVTRELASRGVRVALVARTVENLEALVNELGAERARAFAADVSQRATVLGLPQRVMLRRGLRRPGLAGFLFAVPVLRRRRD
jgi:NADP-dependent 3-hydroxy acid dehydrogenase YdfG